MGALARQLILFCCIFQCSYLLAQTLGLTSESQPVDGETAAKADGVDTSLEIKPLSVLERGFLYLEHGAGRHEILINLPTALQWVGKKHNLLLPVSDKDQITYRNTLTTDSYDWFKVHDGENIITPRLRGITFLKGTWPNLKVLQPEDLLVSQLIYVSMVWSFPLARDLDRLELRWKSLPLRGAKIPLSVYYGGSQPDAVELQFGRRSGVWKNMDRIPHIKPRLPVPAVPEKKYFEIALLLWIWVGLGIVWLLWHKGRRLRFKGTTFMSLAVWILGIFITAQSSKLRIPLPSDKSRAVTLQPNELDAILNPLLKNAYQALRYPTENEVKEEMQKSFSPEQAAEFYDRAVNILSLEGDDGTVARVNDLGLTVKKAEPVEDGYLLDAEWTVLATGHHWGHVDQRGARLKARLKLSSETGCWLIREMSVQEERQF